MAESQDPNNKEVSSKELQTQLQQLTERTSYLENEAKNAFKARDLEREENKTLKARLAEIESKEVEEGRSKARSKQDIDALESSWKVEIEKEKRRSTELETKLRNLVIENQVKDVAAKVLDPKGVDIFYKLHKDNFDYEEQDGKFTPRLKNDIRSIEQFVVDWSEEVPSLKMNKTLKGSGSGGGKIESKPSTVWTLDEARKIDASKMSREEKENLFSKIREGDLN
jgi:hypothetical protein